MLSQPPRRNLLSRRPRSRRPTFRKDSRPRPRIPTGSSRRTTSKKPKEDDPKITTVQTQASTEAPAQEATSRQTLDEERARGGDRESPEPRHGKDKQKLTADWGRKISAYFELHKRYPQEKKTKSTTVKVALVLNRRGNVVSVDVLESPGDPAFDEAAISMIRRPDPVPQPPAALTDDQFAFSLNVNFNGRK